MARDFLEECPNCKSINISVRQRTIPKYRCQDCKNVFDNPKAEIVYTTHKQQYDFGMQHPNPDK